MARFGDFKAIFFARTDLDTPLEDSASVAYRVPISASTSSPVNGIGRTSATLGYDSLIGPLIAEGNVCVIYQYDTLVDDPYIGGVPFSASTAPTR